MFAPSVGLLSSAFRFFVPEVVVTPIPNAA
jgi:hypothetical protein